MDEERYDPFSTGDRCNACVEESDEPCDLPADDPRVQAAKSLILRHLRNRGIKANLLDPDGTDAPLAARLQREIRPCAIPARDAYWINALDAVDDLRIALSKDPRSKPAGKGDAVGSHDFIELTERILILCLKRDIGWTKAILADFLGRWGWEFRSPSPKGGIDRLVARELVYDHKFFPSLLRELVEYADQDPDDRRLLVNWVGSVVDKERAKAEAPSPAARYPNVTDGIRRRRAR